MDCDSVSGRYEKREIVREREQWEKATQVWQSGICAVVCVQYMCVLVSVHVCFCWGSEGHPEWHCRLCVCVCIHADTFGACSMALIVCIQLHLQRRHKQAVKHTTDSNKIIFNLDTYSLSFRVLFPPCQTCNSHLMLDGTSHAGLHDCQWFE